MNAEPLAGVNEATPTETWTTLAASPKTLLVDVRTRAEWSFVGTPDLTPLGRDVLLCEWVQFPAMVPNPRFVSDVDAAVTQGGVEAVYFLCRSGARSLAAAQAMQTHFAAQGRPVRCVNVREGFEGDLDASGHRGALNGWKARGLAWRQS